MWHRLNWHDADDDVDSNEWMNEWSDECGCHCVAFFFCSFIFCVIVCVASCSASPIVIIYTTSVLYSLTYLLATPLHLFSVLSFSILCAKHIKNERFRYRSNMNAIIIVSLFLSVRCLWILLYIAIRVIHLELTAATPFAGHLPPYICIECEHN